MSAEYELVESWKLIPAIQQQASLQGITLEQQANWLGATIEEKLQNSEPNWEAAQKEQVLASLSLLSEIFAMYDFDKMIEVREKFQQFFPEHFAEYLKNLDSLSWQAIWPGCFECSHFADMHCERGVAPTNIPGTKRIFDRQCRYKEKRLNQAA